MSSRATAIALAIQLLGAAVPAGVAGASALEEARAAVQANDLEKARAVLQQFVDGPAKGDEEADRREDRNEPGCGKERKRVSRINPRRGEDGEGEGRRGRPVQQPVDARATIRNGPQGDLTTEVGEKGEQEKKPQEVKSGPLRLILPFTGQTIPPA